MIANMNALTDLAVKGRKQTGFNTGWTLNTVIRGKKLQVH